MTTRPSLLLCLLLAAPAFVAGCRSSTTSVPLPAADSAAIMAKAHAADSATLAQKARATAATGSSTQKPAVYIGDTVVSPHPAPSGSTVVQFVVDSTGRVRASTFKVVHVTDLSLVDDARRVLRRWRYMPAEVDGRKVSQLVETAIVR